MPIGKNIKQKASNELQRPTKATMTDFERDLPDHSVYTQQILTSSTSRVSGDNVASAVVFQDDRLHAGKLSNG